MSLVTIAVRIAMTTSGAASAVNARIIRAGRISNRVAPSPQIKPTGIATATAVITQTYKGMPPGRLSGSWTAGTSFAAIDISSLSARGHGVLDVSAETVTIRATKYNTGLRDRGPLAVGSLMALNVSTPTR